MAIAVICRSCKASFAAKDQHAGKRVKCPRCSAVAQLPPALPPANPPEVQEVPDEAPVLTKRDILRALRDDIEPVRTTAGYRFGMLVVSGALLLLPVLYVS